MVILFILSLYFYSINSKSNKDEKITFNIDNGTSTKEIVNNLYEAGLIKSKLSTFVYIKLHNNLIIQAGTYELNRNLSTKEILNILDSGKIINNTVTITFVEGKKITDYIKQIKEIFGYSEEDILNTINDKEYIKGLREKYSFLGEEVLNDNIYYPLEGYLFPSTYEFYKDASINTIFEKMLDKTGNVLDNYSTSIERSGFSLHEILTMASIIENETMVKEDRSIASQVIHKRLNLNMSLGMDVTAYYGVKKDLTEELTTSDLRDNNAYNTRNTSFIGLPVGPISNPSTSSIEAALNPSDTDYLYFYADKSGKLHFAKDNEEFQEVIRTYS